MKTTVLTASIAVTFVAVPAVYAGGNPFTSQGFAGGYMIAEKGRDMAGNEVELPANFTYGGDNTGAYAGGKIGTGTKDPAVCGTYQEIDKDGKCSITYTKGK